MSVTAIDPKSGFPQTPDGLPYRPCVGIMLINNEGLVWIGSRASNGKAQNDYKWQMPQGGIDLGEAPEPAARRELFEETSVRSIRLLEEATEWFAYDYPEDVVRTSRKGKYRGQAQKWIAYRFEGADEEINVVTPPDGHSAEFDAWRWEKSERLAELIVPFKRPVYERVIAAFSHLTR